MYLITKGLPQNRKLAFAVCLIAATARYNNNYHRFGANALATPYMSTSTITGGNADNNSPTAKVSVAVVGGGIAGLSCAQALSSAPGSNFDVTVYDTGRLRPGGRCSSRFPGDKQKEDDTKEFPILSQYRYDHAAQLISVPANAAATATTGGTFSAFRHQLETWTEQGIVKECPQGSVCQIQKNGSLKPISQATFYYGTEGMGSIPLAMTNNKMYNLEQDVWVSPSSGVKYQKETGKWKLQAKGNTLGYYDQLILAHNGKCADRIMSKTPSKKVHELLKVNFNPTVPASGGKKMTLNSIYSLTFALPAGSVLSKALKEPFISGFCQHPALRMITCQTRKYNNDNKEHEVWTVLSSAGFAKKYKAPQEFLPEATVETVSSILLEALAQSIFGGGMGEGQGANEVIEPLEKYVQLWGAGVPLNVWKPEGNGASDDGGFLHDGEYNVGVCGDWLLDPSVAGAWTSGRRLSEHMLTNLDRTAGLEGAFHKSEGSAKLGVASLDV